MNIIRFYDDTNVIINQIPLKNLLTGPYETWEVEYCTYELKSKAEKTKVWSNVGTVPDRSGWDLNDGNNYYVFLDTRWEGEPNIPKNVEAQLHDEKIRNVYVYTRFDESAAEDLSKDLQSRGVRVCGVEKIYISRPIDSLQIIKEMLDKMQEEGLR